MLWWSIPDYVCFGNNFQFLKGDFCDPAFKNWIIYLIFTRKSKI